ncbi:MAG: sodium-dependent dicarboxylate transporter 2/3/5, partial [Limisphaerales bacterium]
MKSSYSIYKKIGLILGPVLFLLLYNLPISLVNPEADRVIAIAVWMIIWWITEAVSISVTALIPLTFFPLLGIADIKTVAASYGSPIIFLFFGGFVMALALEKVNLHKRIALHIVKQTGSSPDRIILGFMLATAFLSMWISNTATTVVMLPIALSVIHLLINDEDGFTGKDRNFSICMILGIAYAANVGGIATIIGTPPNTVAVGFMQNEYGISISFLSWMLFGVPFSAIMIGIIYLVLVKLVYADKTTEIENSGQIIKSELAALGPLAGPEKRVLIIFIITVLLWILRIQINKLLPELSLTDTGISLLAAFAFFSLPYQFKTGTFTLKWEDTTRLPWGILILFGGGLALASGLSGAGVIDYIGS